MLDSPYWVSLAPGCALGYRKGPKGGVWLAKLVRGVLRQQTTIGPADDALDPDGLLAISYADAQARARAWFDSFRHFVASMPAPVASGWSGRRAGLAPAGKAPPCHGARGELPFARVAHLREIRLATRSIGC
jgi:hypothetical protein